MTSDERDQQVSPEARAAFERLREALPAWRPEPPLLPHWAACPPPRSHMVDEEV